MLRGHLRSGPRRAPRLVQSAQSRRLAACAHAQSLQSRRGRLDEARRAARDGGGGGGRRLRAECDDRLRPHLFSEVVDLIGLTAHGDDWVVVEPCAERGPRHVGAPGERCRERVRLERPARPDAALLEAFQRAGGGVHAVVAQRRCGGQAQLLPPAEELRTRRAGRRVRRVGRADDLAPEALPRELGLLPLAHEVAHLRALLHIGLTHRGVESIERVERLAHTVEAGDVGPRRQLALHAAAPQRLECHPVHAELLHGRVVAEGGPERRAPVDAVRLGKCRQRCWREVHVSGLQLHRNARERPVVLVDQL
eukprot:scaffold79594_cov75-Phaeocystis_antarctica.AAC.1